MQNDHGSIYQVHVRLGKQVGTMSDHIKEPDTKKPITGKCRRITRVDDANEAAALTQKSKMTLIASSWPV